jgi:dihydrolipoamide dehydrogenase
MSSRHDYDVIVLGGGAPGWLTDRGIDLLRGTGRLAGTGVVEVDGVSHTAEHIVVATGADPFVPQIPGLRDLEGVWGTREATSMNEVPRRLLVLGGGPAGVELAQVVRRLGGEAVVIDGAEHLQAAGRHGPAPARGRDRPGDRRDRGQPPRNLG